MQGVQTDTAQVFPELVRAGARLAEEPTQAGQLKVLVDQGFDISGAALCAAYLYSDEGDLQLRFQRGRFELPKQLPRHDEVVDFLQECGEALVLHERNAAFFSTAFLADSMQSAAVLPLQSSTDTFGYLFLNAPLPDFFSRLRFQFLNSFVRLAGGTLHSATLYRELQQQYRQMEELERYQENIFSSMTNLLVATDAKGRIHYFNRAAREKLALDESALNRKFYSVFSPAFSKKTLSAIQKAEDSGHEVLGIQGIMKGSGDTPEMDYSMNISPLSGKRGKHEGVIMLFTDQTAEKQLRSEMSTVVEERRAIKDMFARYLSQDIIQSLMDSPELIKPGGDKKTATICFADIRGYTSFTEQKEPEYIIDVLNAYFTQAVEVILKHQGFIDKFIGDCIMAAWGVPMFSAEQDANSAVACAVEIQELVKSKSRTFFTGEAKHLQIGVGMHTGPLIAGNLGSTQRMDYSVIGDTVNVAARLEGVAGPGEIIITQDTRDLLGDRFKLKELEPVQVKGKNKPLHIFSVLSQIR